MLSPYLSMLQCRGKQNHRSRRIAKPPSYLHHSRHHRLSICDISQIRLSEWHKNYTKLKRANQSAKRRRGQHFSHSGTRIGGGSKLKDFCEAYSDVMGRPGIAIGRYKENHVCESRWLGTLVNLSRRNTQVPNEAAVTSASC